MPKINLLYVITKLELGGAQKQLLSLISNLDKKRFNLFLFTAKDGLLISEAASLSDLILKRSRWLERAINPFKDLSALIEIYRFIKKNNIDIVHTHSSKAGVLGRFAARLAKVNIIIHTVHGWSFNDYQPRLLRILFIWLERISAKFTDRIIVVSNYDRQRGLDSNIGDKHKYRLIRYGINYEEFNGKTANVREEFAINHKDLVVGTVSCFKPQKSPQDFIKTAFLVNQVMPDVKFILVGDGILRNRVKKMIEKFNLQRQVILTGWRRDIARILSSIDVFALTSLWEGLPISVLEAMVSSKPVVATSTAGTGEVIIKGKTGFLVAPGNTKEIAEKLTILLKDGRLRKEMGQNAKGSLGSSFRLENMAKSHQDLYEDLVREKGGVDAC